MISDATIPPTLVGFVPAKHDQISYYMIPTFNQINYADSSWERPQVRCA